MVRHKVDKETKKNILKARKWIEDIAQKETNEADTSTRIHDMCEMLMGYDRHEHITKEFQIPTAGETVFCDLAVQIDREEPSKPDFLIEVKRVKLDLAPKYIGKAASYAIDIGCEWVLVTNGREWKFYHVSFEKPPQTTLVESWNLIDDAPATLAAKFALIGYRNVKKDGLSHLWEKFLALMPRKLLKIILSEQSLKSIRSKLKKATDVAVTPEEIVGAIRRLLNQTALAELENIKISLAYKKPRKKSVPRKIITNEEENKQEV